MSGGITANSSGARPTFVILGSSGALASQHIVPALRSLKEKGLPRSTELIGVDRKPAKDDTLYSKTVTGDLTTRTPYRQLNELLGRGNGYGPCVFYLATPPSLFSEIIVHLGQEVPVSKDRDRSRVIIEKPFGTDRVSARQLEGRIHRYFGPSQVYRVDHFLGKEGSLNILSFRFANAIFEPTWNREHIDNVQIMLDESLPVGARAGYFDVAGVLRDMVQNHILQILCLVAMGRPSEYTIDAIGERKAEILNAIRTPSDAVWAQYEGYGTEIGRPTSRTPTFVALTLQVDSDRWRGVPFYLRTGKMMSRKTSEVVVEFKPVHDPATGRDISNRVVLRIQPNPGVGLTIHTKALGRGLQGETEEVFLPQSSPSGQKALSDYERLILDVLRGDQALFVRKDFNDLAWKIFDPLLSRWEAGNGGRLHYYRPGSSCPKEAIALLARDARAWHPS